jgi:hypothetical protein
MRVRDHIAVSTTSAALVHPRRRSDALGLWAGGVLIDVDHYVWFCAREHSCNPLAAVRFFNEARPPQHAGTRAFHRPAAPVLLLLLGVRHRALSWVAFGMLLHIALDLQHERRMDRARAAALERDAFTCQTCGVRGQDLGTHIRSQPWLLPSYEVENVVTLCDPCHEAAHA